LTIGAVDFVFLGDFAELGGVVPNIEISKAPQTSKLMKRPNCDKKR
jgi:hypothetical protein